jgi:hypothetical protein
MITNVISAPLGCHEESERQVEIGDDDSVEGHDEQMDDDREQEPQREHEQHQLLCSAGQQRSIPLDHLCVPSAAASAVQ